MTNEELHQQFQKELNELLLKYDAEIVVREKEYCYQYVADGINVDFNYQWSSEGDITRHESTLELGMGIHPEESN